MKEVNKINKTKSKVVKLSELTQTINELQKQITELKKLHPYYWQNSILNDYRTNLVINGDYSIYYNKKNYIMDAFKGVVVKTMKYTKWPTRIWVKIRLRNKKYLAFFLPDNNDIKKDIIIEVTGICYKKDNYNNIEVKGGYRRILCPDELNQLNNGVQYEDLKANFVPESFLTELKITQPIEEIDSISSYII